MLAFTVSSGLIIVIVVVGLIVLATLHLLRFLSASRACWKHEMQSKDVAALLRASRPKVIIRLRGLRRPWLRPTSRSSTKADDRDPPLPDARASVALGLLGAVVVLAAPTYWIFVHQSRDTPARRPGYRPVAS
jgi:hypothetical protein